VWERDLHTSSHPPHFHPHPESSNNNEETNANPSVPIIIHSAVKGTLTHHHKFNPHPESGNRYKEKKPIASHPYGVACNFLELCVAKFSFNFFIAELYFFPILIAKQYRK
jgi:hypothetical protein